MHAMTAAAAVANRCRRRPLLPTAVAAAAAVYALENYSNAQMEVLPTRSRPSRSRFDYDDQVWLKGFCEDAIMRA